MRPTLLASLRPSSLAALLVASSSVTCLAPDESHCAHRPGELRGHVWCQAQHPERPWCSRCEPSASGHDGCTDDEPRLECLVGAPADEPAESSSGVPTDATNASTTDVTVCLPAACELSSPSRPLCSEDEQCVPCDQAGGDEACAAVDPDRPACVTDGDLAGACVRCTDASFCPEAAPICDADSHACVRCRFHSDCRSAVGSACRIETGQCLPPALVRHVDASAGPGGDGSAEMPFTTIAQALNNPDLLDYGTIVLHRGDYGESSSVVGGRVIAIVAAPGDRPRISGDAESGLVAAVGAGTELYLEGLTLLDNDQSAGLRVTPDTLTLVEGDTYDVCRVVIEHVDQFGDVLPGARVNFQVSGEDYQRTGKIISSTSLNSDDLSSDIRVQIKPDAPLDSALAGRPVEVRSDRGPSMDWLISKASAAGL